MKWLTSLKKNSQESNRPYCKVIDDFLPPSLFEDMQNLLLGPEFLWHCSDQVVPDGDAINYYFMHRVYLSDHFAEGPKVTDAYWQAIRPMLYFIDDRFKFQLDHLFSISCNLFTNQNRQADHEMHHDMNEPHWVGLYYVNTCNGPTIFEDFTVDCVANRFVLFDGQYLHKSNLPTDTIKRVNINFNMAGHFRD